jgi:hypothetical protein
MIYRWCKKQRKEATVKKLADIAGLIANADFVNIFLD